MRAARSFALIVACSLVGTACSGEAARQHVAVGSAVPAYAAVGLGGDSVSLADHRGKVVLLNVWATWCHPCRDEIPELLTLQEKYGARGFTLVGVSIDTESADEAIRAFMRDFRMTYPVWRDPAERVSAQFHIVGVPATFLIDREGVLRWRKTGPIAAGDKALEHAIEQALGS